MIGDKDPEDAYDAGDPIGVRLDVLERVVDSLRDNGRADPRFDGRLNDLRRLLANVDRENLNRRDNRRLGKIRDDVEEL